MITNVSGPIGLVGLVFLGIAVFWARQMLYGTRGDHHQNTTRLVLGITATTLVLVGLLGVMAHLTLILAPFLMAIVCMQVMRYRSMERRMLVNCISVAARKGIPIQQAVRGFANERADELGYRAAVLAEGLEAGLALPDAMQFAKTRLPTDILLAIRLGCETGMLGSAISRVAKPNLEVEVLGRSVFEKLLYLIALCVVMATVFALVTIGVVAQMETVFREFSVEIPPTTRLIIRLPGYLERNWFLFLPMMFVMVAMLFFAGLHYVGILPRGFPGVGWITHRFDSGLVMRCLAMAVSHSWPMNRAIWQLARIFPKRGMRGRLAEAGRHIDNGEEWHNSLWYSGIINRADWGVLSAATRVGNVEWALEELAESSVRRIVYRWKLFVSVFVPCVLVVIGGAVALFAVGLFIPLVNLIHSMS